MLVYLISFLHSNSLPFSWQIGREIAPSLSLFARKRGVERRGVALVLGREPLFLKLRLLSAAHGNQGRQYIRRCCADVI
jgi:hypothetical protein